MKKENSMLNQMEECMKAEEKSLYTIRKYMSDARVFLGFIDSRSGEITKQEVLLFKQQLARSYSPGSANTKIASVNYLLRVLGKQDCMVKYFRLQHSAFREEKKMLSKEEYFALLEKKNGCRNPAGFRRRVKAFSPKDTISIFSKTAGILPMVNCH